MKQVMVPHPGSNLPVVKDNFNSTSPSLAWSLKKPLGRLKGCWQFLEGPVKMLSPSRIMDFIIACEILHNICVEKQEPYDAYEEPDESLLARLLEADSTQGADMMLYQNGAKPVRDLLSQYLVTTN